MLLDEQSSNWCCQVHPKSSQRISSGTKRLYTPLKTSFHSEAPRQFQLHLAKKAKTLGDHIKGVGGYGVSAGSLSLSPIPRVCKSNEPQRIQKSESLTPSQASGFKVMTDLRVKHARERTDKRKMVIHQSGGVSRRHPFSSTPFHTLDSPGSFASSCHVAKIFPSNCWWDIRFSCVVKTAAAQRKLNLQAITGVVWWCLAEPWKNRLDTCWWRCLCSAVNVCCVCLCVWARRVTLSAQTCWTPDKLTFIMHRM